MSYPLTIVRLASTFLLALGFPLHALAAPMTLKQYMALDGPSPTQTIPYGSAPSQYAELFEPDGAGPFPVVVLVHGGCWQKEFGGIRQMHSMAGALRADGIAVWNVEYRRVDESGGGYPGTYQDINQALDTLAEQASAHHLDLQHLVAVGHSAGGQLVQWMGARARIASSSPVYDANAYPIREVVSLGGLADLRKLKSRIQKVCEVEMPKLTGTPSAGRSDPYSDTDVAALLPTGSHTVLINGALDHQVPPSVARAFAARARAAGDHVETQVVPGASHFDEVTAGSPAWPSVLKAIRQALGRPVE